MICCSELGISGIYPDIILKGGYGAWRGWARQIGEQPGREIRDRGMKNVLLTHLLPSHFPTRASVAPLTFRIKFLDTMG